MNLVLRIGLCLTWITAGTCQLPARDMWVSLFDGKDLSGWREYGKEKWTVANSEIVGETLAGKYGYLVTERTYRDFVIRLRFKCEGTGDENYGVFLRSRIVGEGKYGPDIVGTQVEVDPKHRTGGIYETGGREWIAFPSESGERAMKPHDWNFMEIAIEGRHIVTRLNGIQIVDFVDPEPHYFDGAIGLQLHTGGAGKIRWKDIEIMEIGK